MYRSRYPKPVHKYDVLKVFGPNIVASEGEQWKKYRKISASAFSEVSIYWKKPIPMLIDEHHSATINLSGMKRFE